MAQKICNPETEKQQSKYHCEFCDYSCQKLFLFNQHLKTKKHKNHECSKMLTENMQTYVCSCGKIYKHIQSYNRHIKNCKTSENKIEKKTVIDSENDLLRGMITTLIEQNKNIILENKEMRDMVTTMMPQMGNNNYTINNKFNIQVFLHEKCKDAVNLTDFVDSLKVEMNDLDETRKSGFISGITNIFVRELKQLDLHKRPIHCSDLKRETLYIKTNDNWEKDDNKKHLMKTAITTIAKRQINKIKEWELAHPDWNKTDAGTTQYMEMVKNVTDIGEDNQRNKSENKIIKSIAKEVMIDK